ncbi:MAG: hypothetical protein V3S51_05435 [Dehalococcoidia bacterium]
MEDEKGTRLASMAVIGALFCCKEVMPMGASAPPPSALRDEGQESWIRQISL